MKTLKFALGAMLAAGVSVTLPSVSQGQYAPGGVNTQLAEQRKQKQEADAEVARVQKEITKIKGRITAKYETKEEWETAKTDLKAAESAYEAARKKAVAKLYTSPEYKAAKDKQLKSEQALQALQGNAKGNPKDLEKAQTDRLQAGITLRNLETAALAGEPKVAEAKKAWEALQDELKEALQQDPEYIAAQDQLVQAQAMQEQIKLQLAQQAAADREARRAASEGKRGSPASRPPRNAGGARGGYGVR